MEKEVTKSNSMATKVPVASQVNDIGFRLILIPFFGIAIPLITRLVDHDSFSNWEIKLSYAYTIGLILPDLGRQPLPAVYPAQLFQLVQPTHTQTGSAYLFSIVLYHSGQHFIIDGMVPYFKAGLVNWNIVTEATLIIMVCVVLHCACIRDLFPGERI